MKYSIVIPVYNSEKTIGVLIEELIKFFSNYSDRYEIICINDCSTDDSWKIIENKLIKYPDKILAIDLVKNYGQQSAIYCGLKNSTGEYIITMDDDLQNPVNEIEKLIVKSKEGYDVVIGKFTQKKHNFIRRLGSKIVRYFLDKIFDIPKNLHMTNFRIIKRIVIERIFELKIQNPYLPGLYVHYSSSVTNINVKHNERLFGSSNYNTLKIIKLVSELLFNHSTYPLRGLIIIGLFISIISFSFGFFFFVKALIYGSQVPGWSSVFVLISFLGSLILVTISMIGEYLIRINKNLSSNNRYFIRQIKKNKC